jgi:hypothetical protein
MLVKLSVSIWMKYTLTEDSLNMPTDVHNSSARIVLWYEARFPWHGDLFLLERSRVYSIGAGSECSVNERTSCEIRLSEFQNCGIIGGWLHVHRASEFFAREESHDPVSKFRFRSEEKFKQVRRIKI